jgi:hypothetical protein
MHLKRPALNFRSRQNPIRMPVKNPNLNAKLQSAEKNWGAIERSERDRATYLLATMICDSEDPLRSIAQLEKLGEEKLRQIVAWLNAQGS